MGEPTAWMDLYAFDGPQDDISTAKTLANGVDTDDSGILLTNHPSIAEGLTIIDQRKTTGLSQRYTTTGYEFQEGTKVPVFNPEFDGNCWNLALILWSFFQNGASESGLADPYTISYVPYTDGDVDECWLTWVRKLSTGSNSHRLTGAICNSITFTMETGGALKVSANFMGKTLEKDHDPADDNFTFAAKAPLLFQDSTVKLDTVATAIPSISITLTNNLVPKLNNVQTVSKFVLNDLDVTGSITIPGLNNTQAAKFASGTDTLLDIQWGDLDTAGDLKISVNMRYTGEGLEGDDELNLACPFVGAYDGTNNAVAITLLESIERSIT